MSALRRVVVVASLLTVPGLSLAQQAAPAQPQRYTVVEGDTCVAISRHFYGSSRDTALIHRANPTMGPPPHRLRAGTVLVIPPRESATNAPDALLTAVHNAVEVRAQALPAAGSTGAVASRPGRPNDPLYRGNRVNTQERSSAEVTFADETQLQLAERTLIVILGETSTRVRRDASAADTALERGTLTAFLASLDHPRAAPPPPPAVSTDAGRVTFERGTEARLEVDERRRSTLAVYRGGSSVSVPRQRVRVPQGYGVRAVRAQRIPRPRLLPLAPAWVTRPTMLTLATADTVTVVGEVAPGDASTVHPGPGESIPAPARWHIEVSNDARFNAVIADVRGPAAQPRIEIPGVEPGAYFMRVSAIDAEGFQGPPSVVATTVVARFTSSEASAAGVRRVTVTAGLFCGLDGAPLVAVTDAPVEMERRHAHTLRCAVDAAGAGAVERTFEAERLGPLRLEASLRTSDAQRRTGSARVRALAASGAAIPREGLRIESADASVLVGEPTPVEGAAGEYDVSLQWTRGVSSATLRASFEDERAEASLTLPEELVARPAVLPPDRVIHRLSLRLEGGAGYILSEFQRNTDRAAFDGNAPALSWAWGGDARVGFQLLHPDGGTRGAALAIELGGAYWRLPAGAGSTLDHDFASFTVAHGGLRFEPFAGRLRFFVDAHAGAGVTGGAARLALDAGIGLDVPIGPVFSLGPFARYYHIVQPGDRVTDEDARLLTAGLSLSLRPASARW